MILDKDINKLKKSLKKGNHTYFNALEQWQPPSKVHCISVEQKSIVGWGIVRWYATTTNAEDYIYYRGLLGDDENQYRIVDKTKEFNK